MRPSTSEGHPVAGGGTAAGMSRRTLPQHQYWEDDERDRRGQHPSEHVLRGEPEVPVSAGGTRETMSSVATANATISRAMRTVTPKTCG